MSVAVHEQCLRTRCHHLLVVYDVEQAIEAFTWTLHELAEDGDVISIVSIRPVSSELGGISLCRRAITVNRKFMNECLRIGCHFLQQWGLSGCFKRWEIENLEESTSFCALLRRFVYPLQSTDSALTLILSSKAVEFVADVLWEATDVLVHYW